MQPHARAPGGAARAVDHVRTFFFLRRAPVRGGRGADLTTCEENRPRHCSLSLFKLASAPALADV